MERGALGKVEDVVRDLAVSLVELRDYVESLESDLRLHKEERLRLRSENLRLSQELERHGVKVSRGCQPWCDCGGRL